MSDDDAAILEARRDLNRGEVPQRGSALLQIGSAAPAQLSSVLDRGADLAS